MLTHCFSRGYGEVWCDGVEKWEINIEFVPINILVLKSIILFLVKLNKFKDSNLKYSWGLYNFFSRFMSRECFTKKLKLF